MHPSRRSGIKKKVPMIQENMDDRRSIISSEENYEHVHDHKESEAVIRHQTKGINRHEKGSVKNSCSWEQDHFTFQVNLQ